MRGRIKVQIVDQGSGAWRAALPATLRATMRVQRVDSAAELRAAACEFGADIILGLDLPCAADAELDLLGLIARQPPEVLICEFVAGIAPAEPLAPAREGCAPCEVRALPSLFERTADSALITDRDGWITHANPAACRLLARGCATTLATQLAVDFGANGMARCPQVLAFDADKRAATRLHVEDLTRCLTTLAIDDRSALPLMAINWNDARLLNGLYGTATCNQLLSVISSTLQPRACRCGMFARIDADHFLLVLPFLANPGDAALAVQVEKETCAALVPPQAPRRAGAANLKAAPPARPSFAAPSASVETRLTDAIQRQAIGVHFQPQYETQKGHGSGMEALARWTLSSGETILPRSFIPLAARMGMMDALGASVLQNTCSTAATWRGKDAERLTVSVNLATQQIGADYSRVLSAALEGSGLAASRLELEVEESALTSERVCVLDCLKTWQQWGVRIAVNHAGRNYSNLRYLSRIHIDRLKLDQSLVQGMTSHSSLAAAVHAVIALGEQMHVDVMAEGVETHSQLALLRELGCPHVQGFLLARPMPALQAQLALRKNWGNLPRAFLKASAQSRVN